MAIEKGRLQANGLSFAVLAAGGRDRPVALLLHGFPEGKESWEPQLEALASAGWRAVAPDLRGYGGTDAPKGQEAYSMAHLVADVEGLVTALGEDSVDLVGHDWGALVGWSFVSRHPRLVRTWTSLSIPHPVALARASGLDGNPHPDPDQQQRSSYIGLFQKAGKGEEVMLEDDARRLRAMYRMGPNPDAVGEDTVEHFVKSLQRPGRLSAALSYYRANLRPQAHTAYPPCPEPIRSSTRLLWGAEDPAVGRLAVEATAAMVEGPYQLQVLPETGHWLQFERPKEVSAAIVDHIQSRQ